MHAPYTSSTTFVGVALRRIPADLHTVNTIGSLRICTVAWPPHICDLQAERQIQSY